MEQLISFYEIISTTYYFKVVSRILVAVIIGGIVGFEREHKNRPAGFRTHILVCVSACSLIILSELLFLSYYESYNLVFDPQRIAAQVVSGVGFLGAGTIIHSGNTVRGLTTAASIWAVAALGLICGSGFFFLAIFTLIVIELVLTIFNRYSQSNIFKAKTIELFVTIIHSPEVVGNITMFFAERKIEIFELTLKSSIEQSHSNVKISNLKLVLNCPKNNFSLDDIILDLEKNEGILSVEY